MRSSLAVLALVVLGLSGRASSQELDARTTDRCVKAAVRIVVPGPDGQPLASGSGSMIDARGYVLTNFHVVGNVTLDHGAPGTLFVPGNRYEIALSDSAREAARPRFLAQVVRGDARLDLALLRIVSGLDGRPLPRGTRFETVPIADTAQLRPGSRVWAFGFPLGVRTINVTGGQVTGFQMNADDRVAWLRSDAEFNPGNSGGMLVDARGRLVAVPTAVVRGRNTLEPIELARPAERIPADWLTAMRRGIDELRVDGVGDLRDGSDVTDAVLGDAGGLGEPELHFYRVSPTLRPGRIAASEGGLALVLTDPQGRVIRRGQGSIDVGPSDPPELLLAIVAENPAEHPLRFHLSAERVAAPPALASAPAQPAIPPPFASTTPTSATVIRGMVLDTQTGRPMAGVFVLLARPGDDLGRGLAMLVDGRIDEPTFFAALAGFGRTDERGRYEIHGLASGARYPAAAFARGRRPVMLSIAVAGEATSVELNPIPIGP